AAYCKEQPLYLGTAGSYGMEMLTIIREGVWAEYDILAAFHPPVGAAVQVRVGANNQIGVPIEATAEKGMGEIVFAGYKEGVRQIAVDVLYKVAPSSGASGTEPAEPTPDVVQQTMLAANAAEKLAQSVRDDADVGKFTGAKGDKGDIGPTGPKGERGEKGDPGKDAVIDTTLSHAGEAADAAEVGKLKEDLDNIISPNLFNPAAAKENVAISSGDGSEMNGFSGWETTDYIPVSKNDVLYFSANNEPTPYSTGAFYDAQKKFISGFGNPNNNNNITVTSDGYARFSFGTSPEKLQIEKGSRTTYVPYGELKIKADVDNVKEDTDNIKAEVSEVKAEVVKIQEDHSNLFNKDTVVKGAVLPDSGYFDTSFSSWETSDYIPVKPGMTLYFSSNQLPIGVVSTGAYFDKDKKYLSPLKDEPLSITIPDGAYFIRFSKNGGLGNTLNTLKIEQHGITKFTPYGELYVTVNESALPSSILPKWKGLKILTLGDSITAMGGVNGWTYWIKQYLLADKVVNVSVAGSTWQDKVASQTYDGNPQPSTNGNVMGNQVQKVLNAKANGEADYQDFNVITFSFGTNDSVDFSVQTKESVESQFITNYAQNNFTVVPIDNVNRQTLAGAMRYGFQKLHEAYPNAVIFMCTPTQECYETFDSIYKKGDFINFVADRLGAETIDTRRCGIRNIYESQTTIDYDHPEQSGAAPIQTDLLDGIHTNENGAKKIAKYNAREIMKYFMIN
ncbi:SGNH/GDSL hydrolase family protein, partial [Hominenteromicrobium sp.]|uniref:SGNH/GDSL hydrolase family protein n=4 Tax=Hominenteromicrobium sp. TaxID=3073581 RepID=UPI003AB67B6F